MVYFFVKITFFMIFEKKKITLENPLSKPFLKIETTLKKKNVVKFQKVLTTAYKSCILTTYKKTSVVY